MTPSKELKLAIMIWKRGYQIPTYLWAELDNQGYLVEDLQRRYYA